MKRNENLVPKFDEIIFENRNKEYGAFELRRRYKSVTSLSILGGVSICTALMIFFSLTSQTEVKAKDNHSIFVIVQTENLIEPEKVLPPEPKRPAPVTNIHKYIAPEIVEDTVDFNEMMINDFAADSIKDGEVTDYIDTLDYDLVGIDPGVDPEPVIFVEEQPLFPGGNAALLRYIGENLRYPQDAIENNIQGKVFVKFAVWTDGSVRRLEVVKGVNPLLDQEAIRVISSLPMWTPGKQNGKPVPVWFFVPVTFQLKIN